MKGSNTRPRENHIPLLNFFASAKVTSTYNQKNPRVPIVEHTLSAVMLNTPRNIGAFMMITGMINKKKYRPGFPDIIIILYPLCPEISASYHLNFAFTNNFQNTMQKNTVTPRSTIITTQKFIHSIALTACNVTRGLADDVAHALNALGSRAVVESVSMIFIKK